MLGKRLGSEKDSDDDGDDEGQPLLKKRHLLSQPLSFPPPPSSSPPPLDTSEKPLYFQPLHYFTDSTKTRYYEHLLKREHDHTGRRVAAKNEQEFFSNLDPLTQRRCKQATLYVMGRTPDDRRVVIEVVGVETAVTIRLPPVHAVYHPYPCERQVSDELKAERAELALSYWRDHAQAIVHRLLRLRKRRFVQPQGKTKINPLLLTPYQRRTFRHSLIASIELYGSRGSEQDAFLRLYTTDFDAARRLTRAIETRRILIPGPIPIPFAFRLVDVKYDHVQHFMHDMFDNMTPWIAVHADDIQDVGGTIITDPDETRASLHIRLPIEHARKCIRLSTEKELAALPKVAAPRKLAIDIEMHAPERIDAELDDAYITMISLAFQKGEDSNDNDQNGGIQSHVLVFQPSQLDIPEYIRRYERLPRNQWPKWMVDLAEENGGQLPTRETAKPLPSTAPTTLGPPATVHEFVSEEDLLDVFINLLEQYDPDYLIGFFHSYMDIPSIVARAKKYPDSKLYERLLYCSVLPWWRGYERRIDKESNARQALGKRIIEVPGLLVVDLFDLAQERHKLVNYSLNEVSKTALQETKIDNDFNAMFYNFWMLNRVSELAYVMQDSILCLKLFRVWRYHIEVIANADRAFITPKCFVECMQQARIAGRIAIECIRSNIMFAVRDLEAFRSLEINAWEEQEAHRLYNIFSLKDILTHPEIAESLRAHDLDDLAGMDDGPLLSLPGDKTRNTYKQILVNVYNLPAWELRRLVEATPDNARCKGGKVQEPVKRRVKIGGCGDVAGMYARLFVNQCASPDNIVDDARYSNIQGLSYLKTEIKDLKENGYVPHEYLMVENRQGIFPRIVSMWTEMREYHKQEAAKAKEAMDAAEKGSVAYEAAERDYIYHDKVQLALKNLINSMYGSSLVNRATAQFPLSAIGMIITFHGRRTIMGIKDFFEQLGFRTIYGDTDSIMVDHVDIEKMLHELVFSEQDIERYRQTPEYKAIPVHQRGAILEEMRTRRKYTDQECYTKFRALMFETCEAASTKFNVTYEAEKFFTFFLALEAKMYFALSLGPKVERWPSLEEMKGMKLLLRGVRGGVRRDTPLFTRNTLGELYRIALLTDGHRPILEFLCRKALDLIRERVPIEECAVTMTLKKYLDYMVDLKAVSDNIPRDKFYDTETPLPIQAVVAIRESQLHPSQLHLPGSKVTFVLMSPAVMRAELLRKNPTADPRSISVDKKTTLAISLREAKELGRKPYYPLVFATLKNEACKILARLTQKTQESWEIMFDKFQNLLALWYDDTGNSFFKSLVDRLNGAEGDAQACAQIEEMIFVQAFGIDTPVTVNKGQHNARVRTMAQRAAHLAELAEKDAAERKAAREKFGGTSR